MYRMNTQNFSGENGFAVHTGMQRYEAATCWKASDAEEGILVASDGTLTAILPGSELRLDGRASDLKYDLFVFSRNAALNGRIGVGGLTDPEGYIVGGFGSFSCTLLSPRRCLPKVQQAFLTGQPLDRACADLIRPVLRQVLEAALQQARTPPDFAAIRHNVEKDALQPMRDALIRHGLMLESLHLVWIGRTEENHEKRN